MDHRFRCIGRGLARGLLGALAWGAVPGIGQATLLIGQGTPAPPPPNEEDIRLPNGATGTAITGTTDSTGLPVLLTSPHELKVTGSHIGPSGGGGLTDIAVSIPLRGGAFTDLLFTEHLNGSPPAGSRTTISVQGFDEFGNPETLTKTLTLAAGNNPFFVEALGGERISSVAVAAPSSAGVADLRGLRISGVMAVPEPGALVPAMWLIPLGLAGLARNRRQARP